MFIICLYIDVEYIILQTVIVVFMKSFNVQHSLTDWTPQNAASHLGIFCLLRGISSKNGIKYKWTRPNDNNGKVHSSKTG